MKHLILIIFLFSSMSIFAQNTYVPDDNFEQALIDLGYDSGPLDNYVLTANINGVTTLGVGFKNISDLTGIEDFTALTSLNCSGYQLTSLDVSLNTNLTELYCYFGQLTSLNISQNTSLTRLYCWSNQLTSLDVSQNTLLNDLRCYENQLISLDVNQNTLLTVLNCTDNQLTSIDVSLNTDLTSLYCSNNQLSILDISQNTDLISLGCSSNQLTSLDVSQNTFLTTLFCSSNQLIILDVSHNTSLISLGCDDNQLTNLDIFQNTNLFSLFCHENQLTNLDVSNNCALNTFFCFQNQLTNLDVRNSNNINITDFRAFSNPNLTCIFVDDKDAVYLSSWMKDPASTYVVTQAECDALDINDIIQNTDFAIYPNPTKEKFSIETSSEIESVKIYDIFGKMMKAYEKQNAYSLSDLATGVYLIHVRSNNGIQISKLVIE